MKLSNILIVPLTCLGLAGPGFAADYSDPTWPCVQRKVERLSLGLMWTHPVPETLPESAEARRDIQELAGQLGLRKLELEELEPQIAAFAEKYAGDPDMLSHVFSSVFDSLSRRRGQIIGGIGDFSLGQIALTEKIEGLRQEMNAQLDADDPDFDRIDSLEAQLDWDQLIYSDRQKSIIYLCETPVILERRLYSAAQMLLSKVQKD
ncbi:MAG: hypothetical protein NXH74_11725 [Rhodobacteraceae bacterium]|jgi:hypothetical protein|nr:hypothetical protein [Paracoccaceae bacterium]